MGRWGLLTLSACCSAALLAGCQADEPAATTPTSPTKAASAKPAGTATATATAPTTAVPSTAARPTPGQTVDGRALAKRLAAAQLKAKFVRVTMPSGDPELPDTMDIDMVMASPTKVDFSLRFGATEAARYIDDTFYVRNEDPKGPRWVSMTADSEDPDAADVVKTMRAMIQQAPSAQAELIGQGRTTYVGPARVGGRSTNHYTLRLPASVLIDNAIKQQRALAGPGTPEEQELQRSRPAAKGKYVTIHLWVNDRDLVLRQEMRGADLVEGMGGKAAGGVVRITYSRWGMPISIIPPPSAETKPVEDVE